MVTTISHVQYLKPVAEYITSSIVHIINTPIDQEIFPKQWEIPEFVPYPKLTIQHQSKIIDQFQFDKYFQKCTNVLFLTNFAPLSKQKAFTISMNQSVRFF